MSASQKIEEFFKAVKENNFNRVTQNLQDDPNLIRKVNKWGSSVLHEVAMEGNTDMAQFLFDKNIMQGGENAHAEIMNAQWPNGNTPLHVAISCKHVDMAKFLISKGADIFIENTDGETPLHFAVSYGQQDVVKILIDKGADVDAQNNRGVTPLHLAAFFGRKEIAELLIENNADIKIKDNSGKTPLHDAADSRSKPMEDVHIDIAKLILEKDQYNNIDMPDEDGNTPLHLAVINCICTIKIGQKNFVQFLLSRDANKELRNDEGKTPADIAVPEISEFIRNFVYESIPVSSAPSESSVLQSPELPESGSKRKETSAVPSIQSSPFTQFSVKRPKIEDPNQPKQNSGLSPSN